MPNYLVNVNGGATYEFGQYFANNETWVPWTKDGQVVTAHLEGGKGGWWGAQQVGPAQPCSTSAQSRGLAVARSALQRTLDYSWVTLYAAVRALASKSTLAARAHCSPRRRARGADTRP